jgi:superfamily II DNA or RNA helicase
MVQLLGQAAKKICQVTGIMPAIEQAHNWSNESFYGRSPYIVASKQTLCSNQRYKRLQDISLVIVDECHLSATKQYAEFLDYFNCKTVGVTATPKRHDKRAMKNIFEHCSYEMYIVDAVPQGWLVPARANCIQLQSLNLSAVETHGKQGDFKEGQLAKAMEEEKVVYEIASVTAKESRGEKTAVFCASVDEARKVANYLADVYGLKADWICADKKLCTEQRRLEVLRSFSEDPEGVQIVCNVGILTTGWDFPGLQHIVMARPTKSLSLYTQIFGRGTRPLEGVVDFPGSTPESRIAAIEGSAKPFFRMTDLVDASLAHKLIGAVDVLGGKMGLEEQQRAAEKLREATEPRDLSEVLQEAADELEKERQDQERARLAKLKADAQYVTIGVDPFDQFQRGNVVRKESKARMPFGYHKGRSISALDTSYLHKVVQNKWGPDWLRGAIHHELAARSKNPSILRSVEDVNRLLMER